MSLAPHAGQAKREADHGRGGYREHGFALGKSRPLGHERET
jgi:hypothetical protein